MHLGVFLSFHTSLFIISRLRGMFWYFYFYFFIFNSKKLLARVYYALAHEWRLHSLDGACDTTQWSNMAFRCVLGSAIAFSFSWCSAWQRMMGGLSRVVVFFFSFFSFFSRESAYMSSFLFYFSISVLIFFITYFYHWLFRKKFYVFNLVIKLQFVIYYLFFNFLLILLISNFFSLVFLLNFYWFSTLSFNQSLYCFIFFSI
jgi:hypothetical protein